MLAAARKHLGKALALAKHCYDEDPGLVDNDD